MTSTAPPPRPFTVRDQYLASLQPDNTAAWIPPKQQDSVDARVTSSRGRSASPVPNIQPDTLVSVPTRRFSRSPIRGELVGRLSASYEPDMPPITPDTLVQTKSLFQSAYATAVSSSSSVSKNGNALNKSVSTREWSNALDSHGHVAFVKDGGSQQPIVSFQETDANVTPSSIRARNSLGGTNMTPSSPSRNAHFTNKASPSTMAMNRQPTPTRKPIQAPSVSDGTHMLYSSQGPYVQNEKTVHVNNKATATASLQSEPLHFTYSKSATVSDLKKRDSTPKSMTATPPSPNTISSNHPTVKGTFTRPTSPEILQQGDDIQALRQEMEDRMKWEVTQLEARLEHQYNQRFEQMEAKVNERLQQIRSSLQEFLMIAENEGIYRNAMDTHPARSSSSSTAVYKK